VRISSAALIAAVALTACARVTTNRPEGVQAFAPKPVDCKVDVYSNPGDVGRKYEEICLIDSRTGATTFHDKSPEAAIERAKPAACRCGADGILIDREETQDPSTFSWGRGTAQVKAIRYTDDPSTPEKLPKKTN